VGNESGGGYLLITNGPLSGPTPNYPGIALLGFGVLLFAVSFVMRRKGPSGGAMPPRKAPGSV